MPTVGDDFGGYRIERVLGRGAMGIVYAATDPTLKREVAIKVLARELSADAQFAERFRREASIQANFEHPHIVAVHAFGDVEGELYLVMQLIRGDPLSTLLRSGELTRSESLNLLAQVADALDTAHGISLVHRDVKPDNILVSDRGKAFLADFGLTRDITNDVRLTKSGMFIGTVNYVSPEQACGRPPTAAADIYSLAAVLFECMTGRVPYVRESAVAVMHAHIQDPIPSARALDPALPRELDEVIRAGLAKDALGRPGSAVELIELAMSALPVSQARRNPPRPLAAGFGVQTDAPGDLAEGTTLRPTDSRRIRVVGERLADPPEEVATNDPRWRLAVARAVAFVVLAAAAALSLTLGVGELLGDRKLGPVAEQLERAIAEAHSKGLRLATPIQSIEPRADGTSSRVVVLRPVDSQSQTSDEIRIYDVGADQRLRLAFSFRPQARRSGFSSGQSLQTPAGGLPRSFSIRVRRAADFDGLPGDELLVDLAEYAVEPIWPRPLYIYRDSEGERYRLSPLLSPATTRLATMRDLLSRNHSQAGTFGRALVDSVYTRPTTLTDGVGDNPPVSAYAVETYITRAEDIIDPRGKTSGGLGLLAGYIVRAKGYGTAELLEIIEWHINLRARPVTADAAPPPHTVARVGIESSHLDDLLRRYWK